MNGVPIDQQPLVVVLSETVRVAEISQYLEHSLVGSRTNRRIFLLLNRLLIDNDEVGTAIMRSSSTQKWESLELLGCRGSRLSHLLEMALTLPTLKRVAIMATFANYEDSWEALFLAKGVKCLQELCLQVPLSTTCSKDLARAFLSSSSGDGSHLTTLRMAECSFEGRAAVRALAKGLQQNRSIALLNLSYCQLKDDDLKIIAKNLPPTLRQLELVSNYCRSDGMAALTDILLDEDRCLESLNLTNQHPGEYGGTLDLSLLGLSLISNRTLKHLDVSFNLLSSNDIAGLVAALGSNSNTTLQTINLMSNQLDDRSMQLIGRCLPRMKGLQKLNISANRFGEDGADSLLQGLLNNVCLTELSMPRGFAASESIDYFLALNSGGRRLLLEDDDDQHEKISVPLALWALILERVNNSKVHQWQPYIKASVMLHLLQGPVLFGRQRE